MSITHPQRQDKKVCICIPTYNAANTLGDTLESIVSQTYRNIEIMIVDNASTDQTLDIANTYAQKDERVRIFAFSENVGGEGNFTRCIRLARGDYAAIFHSDDIYTETMVAEQVQFLEANNPNSGAVFTLATIINDAGCEQGLRFCPREIIDSCLTNFCFDDIFRLVLKYGNFLTCPSAMVRTKIYQEEIQTWDGKKFATSADLDVWLRILMNHHIGIIKKPLMKYRVSRNSYSYHYARAVRGEHDLFLVLDYYLNNLKDIININQEDLSNYQLLKLKDRTNRAINHVIRNERSRALKLLSDIFSPRYALSAKNSIQWKYLLIGYIVYLLAMVPIGEYGRRILYRIRYNS